ncbi:endolytic transglycosylase MltG [Oceanicoccus sagamiensis]|uniref:Endolytic murein transglycosylase n=1 Tax=Oceanicoccus sagamiensis TaxID=716816 RepID=A0A1X9NJ80_9GAMM|nr:endolytic transglycosylase MltG [Oceanicoccus sagamiensis]ARN75539.1 aminodeoxychorismate lyase [Oceanicoccus sagamiensis]
MPKLLSKVLFLLVLAVVVLIVLAYSQMQRYLATPLNIPQGGVEYTLARGGSLNALAYSLSNKGLLTSPRWLIAYSRLSKRGQVIKAGDYWLDEGLTPLILLDKLEQGDVRYYQVTLVPGWTLGQVLTALRSQPKLKQTIASDALTIKASDLGIEVPYERLEGLFFPDTYRFHSDTSDVELLRQSYTQLQTFLAAEWEKRADKLPYKTPYEALIMASLVEKETGVAFERPEIAGVFVRRLNQRMRLQTDPTIIYGLGASFDGNLRSRHLKDASNLYNTYRHSGLTPTPIALAGAEAIVAALHPKAGSSLYFVAKGDGSHYFSDTLEEHQKAVRKYQIEQRRKNYRSAPKKNNTGDKLVSD